MIILNLNKKEFNDLLDLIDGILQDHEPGLDSVDKLRRAVQSSDDSDTKVARSVIAEMIAMRAVWMASAKGRHDTFAVKAIKKQIIQLKNESLNLDDPVVLNRVLAVYAPLVKERHQRKGEE